MTSCGRMPLWPVMRDSVVIESDELGAHVTGAGEEGSGVISVNGAAAHCAQPGDLVIICAYGVCDEAEAAKYKPTCVYVDRQNQLTHTNHSMPQQAAAA